MIKLLRMWRSAKKTRKDLELRTAATLKTATETLQEQDEMLKKATREIAYWQNLALESQRAVRNLAIAFRASQDSPDVDLRDDLDELVQELQDAVATFEEHMP